MVEYDENYFPEYEEVEVLKEGPIYNSVPLQVGSEEYKDIWRRMNMRDIEVKGIDRIDNFFLERSFKLKEEKKLEENDYVPINTLILFHGTEKKSAKNILRENFDWRKCGSRSRHCYYGKGVYFSHDATVSRKYPKKTFGFRYMILSKVLFTLGMFGKESITIPPPNIDTTFSSSLHEVVKYEDNEFCPTHLIIFVIKNYKPAESGVMINYPKISLACEIPSPTMKVELKQVHGNIRRQNVANILANCVYECAFNTNIETVTFERYSTTSKANWSDEEDLYNDLSDTYSSDESSESEEYTHESKKDLRVSRFYNWFVLSPLNFLKSIFIKSESENDDSDD